LPALVNPEHLQQANALQQMATEAAGIAGPAVAGVFVVTVGPGWAIIVDAGTFFVSAAMLMLIQLSHVPRATGQHWLRDLHSGWTDFWARKWFRDVVIGASVFNLLYAAYVVAGPVAARRYYGGAAAWATIITVGAIGSVVTGAVAVRLRPRHPMRFAVLASVLACLAPLAFGTRLPLAVIAIGAALGGGGLIVFSSLWQTSLQRHVPEQMLSRASSYENFGSFLTFPVGLAIAGPLTGTVGPRAVLLASGILTITETAVLIAIPNVRNLTDEASATSEDDSHAGVQRHHSAAVQAEELGGGQGPQETH
jgi:predicted MFS family arabinose efflux permease